MKALIVLIVFGFVAYSQAEVPVVGPTMDDELSMRVISDYNVNRDVAAEKVKIDEDKAKVEQELLYWTDEP